ncbi:MAG: hypothetical protein ACRD4H_06650 [Candidatus Acidiferrales bacterium]
MRDWRPDWLKEAARKLARAKFSAAEREEVSRELAGHLEDLCSDARRNGLGESSAADRAFAELNEDARLGPNLRRAREENTMNDRTKHLWLPGVTILLTSAISLAIFQLVGFSPYFPSGWNGNTSNEIFLRHSLMINVPWLCVLPFLGAAGAYWARRAGSGRAIQSAVGLFPAIVFLAMFLVIFPVTFAIDRFLPANIYFHILAGVMLSWVVIPAVALLLGILPFLPRSSSHHGTV